MRVGSNSTQRGEDRSRRLGRRHVSRLPWIALLILSFTVAPSGNQSELQSGIARAYARAHERLRARGFKPTSITIVRRNDQPASGVVPAYWRGATSKGEIIYRSWDDGDDRTWEGTVFVRRFSDNAWVLHEYQIDTANPERVYYGNLVGFNAGKPRRQMATWEQFRNWFIPTLQAQQSQPAPRNNAKPMRPSTDYWADTFIYCVAATCAASATRCAFTGPVWPECTGIGCVAGEVGCAVAAFLDWVSG
jgi:hypothetical protein